MTKNVVSERCVIDDAPNPSNPAHCLSYRGTVYIRLPAWRYMHFPTTELRYSHAASYLLTLLAYFTRSLNQLLTRLLTVTCVLNLLTLAAAWASLVARSADSCAACLSALACPPGHTRVRQGAPGCTRIHQGVRGCRQGVPGVLLTRRAQM